MNIKSEFLILSRFNFKMFCKDSDIAQDGIISDFEDAVGM